MKYVIDKISVMKAKSQEVDIGEEREDAIPCHWTDYLHTLDKDYYT